MATNDHGRVTTRQKIDDYLTHGFLNCAHYQAWRWPAPKITKDFSFLTYATQLHRVQYPCENLYCLACHKEDTGLTSKEKYWRIRIFTATSERTYIDMNSEEAITTKMAKAQTLFQAARRQIIILDTKILEQKTRYSRAAKRGAFRTTIGLKLITLKGIRQLVHTYAVRERENLISLLNEWNITKHGTPNLH